MKAMYLLKVKTKPIDHYKQTLGADLLLGNITDSDTKAGTKLIDPYFPSKS